MTDASLSSQWSNSYLSKRKMEVENLATDFQDGVKLGALLEIISGEKLKLNPTPKIELQKLENLNKCIAFLKDQKIQLVNIGSQDVFKGNEKLILGLIWTIILRFEIGDGDGKNGLLLWVQRSCKGYKDVDPPNVQNFTSDWSTGLPFCAIIHRYRPDLLNYDSLSKGNAEANCELAFRVAEEKLGIARLLDVADVANNSKPDEKSIIAYVSQFFKLFAKASKNDALIKSIRNAVEVTKRHDAWIEKYDASAKAVSEFCDKSKTAMTAPSTARTTPQVQKELEAFTAYMRTEKPAKQALRSEADGLATQLLNSKRNNKRPEHRPAIPPSTNATKWTELEQLERSKERALLDKYTRFCAVDNEVNKFTTRAAPVEAWVDERLAAFAKGGLPPTASITEIESHLDMHDQYEARLAQYKQVLTALAELDRAVATASKGEHDSEAIVSNQMKTLKSKMEKLEGEGKKARAALESARDREKEAVELERAFNRAHDALDFDLDQLESQVQEAVVVNSANDVATLRKDADAIRAQIKKAEAAATGELATLGEKLKARRPACATAAASAKTRVAGLEAAMKKRDELLNKALAEETTRDGVRDKFAEAANKLGVNITKGNADLAAVDGSLESQVEKVRALRERVAGPMREELEVVDGLAKEADKLKIVANPKTPHTAFSLRAAHEQLLKAALDEEQSLNAQILAKKALEVSPEQLKEIQEVFKFFDSDNQGYLDLKQLKEACTGAGIDLAEDEIERRMAAASPDMRFTIDDFTAFMLAEVKTGDTKEDVQKAFSDISEGADTLSNEKVDTVFQAEPDLSSYIKTHMKNGNFVAFTENLFSR